MATHNVANASELNSAISSSVSGDEIILANGSYGGITITNVRKAGYVTVKAENALGATIVTLSPKGISYFSFEDLIIGYVNTAADGHTAVNEHFRFLRCDLQQGGFFDTLSTSENRGLLIDQCDIGPRTGNDLMKLRGYWRDVTIKNSVIGGVLATDAGQHLDLLHVMGGAGYTNNVQGLTLRGNIWFDDQTGDPIGAHGIGISDGQNPYYADVLVEENFFSSTLSENVRVQSMKTNCVFRNNTVMNGMSIYDNQGQGNAGLTVQDNLHQDAFNQPSGNTGETLTGNERITNRATQFPSFTNGNTWQQWVPADGAFTAGKGAATRLAEIQAGTNVRALEIRGMTGMGAAPAAARILNIGGGLLYLNGVVVRAS